LVDFAALRKGEKKKAPVAPRTLYGLLPNKDLGRGNLWDAQAQVLADWDRRRDERDLVIKLNTGGGKTTVGLVLLQSFLNAGVAPALYVAPDKYLVKQVVKEAAALGIKITTDVDSSAYLRGEAIGVVNAYKLVNGRSVFSTNRSTPVAIGAVVIDDAHAAIATTRKQLSLEIESSNPAFKKLLDLFEGDLRQASEEAFMDVRDDRRGTPLRVPFWSWRKHLTEAREILREQARDKAPLYFSWPTVSDVLGLCRAVFQNDRLTITAPCPPIGHIVSFNEAAHRVFLSATLADDSVLVTDFNADAESVRNPISPETAGDIGERMILAPQEINPSLSSESIRKKIVKLSKTYNTVVLVPSERWAEVWEEHAEEVALAEDVEGVVERLTTEKHVGLVVLINKYDGIDLPHNACRILVIDGLPEAFSPEQRLESLLGGGAGGTDDRQIQRIEQGMGRGVRSGEDHCVVFLLGASLSKLTVDPRTLPRFSPATRAQLQLSREVAASVEDQPLSKIMRAATQALERDANWVEYAKERLGEVEKHDSMFSESAIAEREAFEQAVAGDASGAAATIARAADAEPLPKREGILREVQAVYTDQYDPSAAQQVLAVARAKNPYVVRPLTGVTYQRLQLVEPQAELASKRLMSEFTSPAALRLHVEAIIDELRFVPDRAEEFEEALYELGRFIGLGSQRPERETNKGPDSLWALGNNTYWVIEAKNGVTNSKGIGKRDMGQLMVSMRWFGERYDSAATGIPVMAHRAVASYSDSTPQPGTRIITPRRLGELAAALRGFAEGLASIGWSSPAEVGRLLEGHQLLASTLTDTFTEAQRGEVKAPKG
jgi:hypothetical protein